MKVASPRAAGDAPADASLGPRAGSAEATRAPRFAALQSRNFRLLWIGLLTSNAGTWMESTGMGWLVTDLEPARKPFWLGMIAAAFAVPMLLIPPFGGAVADRVPRLRMLWAVQITYLVASAVLATLTLAGAITVWHLLAYSFVNGLVLAFDSPVRHALLPDLVTREQLTSAVSLNSVSFTGAALVGPAIAGALIPLIGVGGVFVVNTISCLATLLALSRMRGVPQHSRQSGVRDGALAAIGRGIAHVRRDPLLRGLLTISLVSGLLGRSYGPMLAVFARDEFRVGSTAYGFLLAAGGLGTLAGAFALASHRDVRHRGRWLMVATACQAGLLFLFATCPWYGIALVLLVLVGAATAVAGALTATLIQLTAPNELRGRIMSLYILTLIGVPSAGALLAGTVGEAIGVREAIAFGAVIVVALAGLVFARNASLRTAG
ncbi:MAG TPA: MFS transporter [Thermomicrobiales bacterium]|jgi:MFS family permease